MNDDEKAFYLLEKAAYKAQASLAQTKTFHPFLVLLRLDGEVEVHENELEDTQASYEALETLLRDRMKSQDIDVMVLAMHSDIPDNISSDFSEGIRLHLEEKSQVSNKIGARFLYVPYSFQSLEHDELAVHLYAPIPVGLPAEYITE